MKNENLLENLPIGEIVEVEKGVLYQRRSFIKMLTIAIGAASLPFVSKAKSAEFVNETPSYEQFLKDVVPIAKTLVANTTLAGQSKYLLTLASFAVQIDKMQEPKFRANGGKSGSQTYISGHPSPDAPFVVLHWKMEPNSVIRTHAHTYGNVVTLGLEGEIKIQNYEMVGEKNFEAGKTFKIKKTVEQILTAGKTNLVNLDENYCHGFQGGALGGQGLDITTRIKPIETTTAYLDLSKKPVDEVNGLYEGRWIHE